MILSRIQRFDAGRSRVSGNRARRAWRSLQTNIRIAPGKICGTMDCSRTGALETSQLCEIGLRSRYLQVQHMSANMSLQRTSRRPRGAQPRLQAEYSSTIVSVTPPRVIDGLSSFSAFCVARLVIVRPGPGMRAGTGKSTTYLDGSPAE